MNEKTRAQIEAMKNQTIGVEVEMNNITREKAAKKAAEFFGTRRYEYTAGRNGYYTWSAWDAQGRELRYASPKKQQDENVAYALRCWMLRLGFIGEEFKTAREYFMRNAEGNCAWRHGRP